MSRLSLRRTAPMLGLAVATLLVSGCSSTSGTAVVASTTPTTSAAPSSAPVTSAAPITEPSSTGSPAGSGAAVGSSPAVGSSSTSSSLPVSSASSSSPVSSTPSSIATPPTSTAALVKLTVQRSEVPADYQAKPYQPDPDDAATQAALVRCIGGTNTSKDTTGEAHSPDYSFHEVQISSSAQSFKSTADLDADVALISSPKASSCYEKLFTAKLAASLPSGAAVTKVAIKITPHPAGEPQNVVGTGAGTITVRAQGQTIEVNLAVAFITGPLVEAEVDSVNVGGPVPAALQATLVKKVAARAAAF